MESRALLLLLALFLLIFPFIASTPQAQTPVLEPTSEATLVVSPTDAPAATATLVAPPSEPTAEATLEATAETTPEASGDTRFPSQLLMGDAVHGQDIFEHGLNGAPACINCHSITAAGKVGFALGPGLRGIPEIAATRIADFSAALYLEDSIRFPNDYITPGFRGIMYADFAKNYSDQEIADLVAYLMTLHDIPPAPEPAA
jgi:mono/diheme cytochrome c family protein